MTQEDCLYVLGRLGYDSHCECCGRQLRNPISILRGAGEKCHNEECECATTRKVVPLPPPTTEEYAAMLNRFYEQIYGTMRVPMEYLGR